MQEKIDNTEKIAQHWLDSADGDLKTMTNLVASKDYSWALFLGHLVIEKRSKLCTSRDYISIQSSHTIY